MRAWLDMVTSNEILGPNARRHAMQDAGQHDFHDDIDGDEAEDGEYSSYGMGMA
jgi:hypothetical protein